MAFFLGILLVIFAWLGHVVLWVAIVNRLHAYALPRKLIDLATLASGLLLVLLVWPLLLVTAQQLAIPTSYTLGMAPGPLSTAYAWFCAAVAVGGMLGRLYLACHKELVGVVRDRKSHLLPLPYGPHELLAPGLPRLVGSLPGNQVLRPVVTELELAIPQLPVGFQGLRIAHLSDLHLSGRIGQGYLEAIDDATNQLAPDLVVVTGDIVERPQCLDWIAPSLGRVDPRAARLFVLGNHDRHVGPDNVRQAMTAAGFLNLGGLSESIDLPHGTCIAAGNETPWFGQAPSLPWAGQEPLDCNTFRLALIHTPDLFGWCAAQRFHLALAGHNHGGQVRLPLLGAILAPSRYGVRYASGAFRRQETVLHVSQGTSCLAPLRYNCPPELSLLVLVPA